MASVREIAEILRDRIEEVAEICLGKPTSRTRGELRFGRRGSVAVYLSGAKRGRWFDFERGEGGDTLDLLKVHYGRSAIDQAKAILGITDDAPLPPRPARKVRPDTNEGDAEAAEKAAKFREKLAQARDIIGTIGELYLRNRGITAKLPNNIKFREGNGGKLFVQIHATCRDGSISGLQEIQITADGQKAPIDTPKRTHGKIGGPAGAAGKFPATSPRNELIIAEGPETALSVWQATGCETWCSMGVGNIKNQSIPAGRRLIIAGDNDEAGSSSRATVRKAAQSFADAGIDVWIAEPVAYADLKKTDYNNTLLRDGADAVVAQVFAGEKICKPEPVIEPRSKWHPHFPGPELERDAALEKVGSTIGQFITNALAFARINREVEVRRQDEFAAAGIVGDWADHPDTAKERGKITRKVKKAIAAEHGLSKVPSQGERLLVSGSQGVGKTTAVLKNLAAQIDGQTKVLILEPTLDKAEEVATDFNALPCPAGITAMVVRGRSAIDPDNRDERMCPRHEIADRMAKQGLEVETRLCKNDFATCKFYSVCGYQKQKSRIKAADGGVFVAAHEYGFLPCPVKSPDLVVVDEKITDKAATETSFTADRITSRENWAAVSDDKFEAADLAETFRHNADLVKDAICQAKGQELLHLRSADIDAETLKAMHSYCLKAEKVAEANINPSDDDADIATQIAALEQTEIVKLGLLYRQLRIEMESGRDGLVSIRFKPNHPVKVNGKEERQDRIEVSYLRRFLPKASTPLLIIDGTARVQLLKPIFGELREERISVRRNADITQVIEKTFSRQMLTGAKPKGEPLSEKKRAEAAKLRADVIDWVIRTAAGRQTFIACSLKVEELIKSELPDNIMVGHFGALRGMNKWQDCEVAIILGRDQPSVQALERQIAPFIAGDAEPLMSLLDDKGLGMLANQSRARRMNDGTVTWSKVEVHSDLRAQALLEQIREAELEQAIDRVRPVLNRREVWILTDIVVDADVERVARWAEIRGREGRDRFAEAFERSGRIGLPLSYAELARLHPDLWVSAEAARRDLSRKSAGPGKTLIEYLLGKCPALQFSYQTTQHPDKAHKIAISGEILPESERWDLEAVRALVEQVVGPVSAIWPVVEPEPAPAPVSGLIRPASPQPHQSGGNRPQSAIQPLAGKTPLSVVTPIRRASGGLGGE